jgi:hypothetical protein
VIVVYLKEPQLIATQSWPSAIQQQTAKDIMENLNMYEEPPVANNPVTMDALGNTNQASVYDFMMILCYKSCRDRRLSWTPDRINCLLKLIFHLSDFQSRMKFHHETCELSLQSQILSLFFFALHKIYNSINNLMMVHAKIALCTSSIHAN